VETFEIKKHLLTLFPEMAQWNAKAIPPISGQTMKENLLPFPYSQVTLS
jgi:hypothetical protein